MTFSHLYIAVPRKYEAELIWEREFAHPIHQVMYCDITGDGLSELVVLSSAGLHILQVKTCFHSTLFIHEDQLLQ